MNQNILIIGGGEMGRALYNLFKKTGQAVSLYDKNPDRSQTAESLDELTRKSDAVFLCVPSGSIEEVMLSIKDSLSESAFVVSLAKGIDKNSGKFVHQIMERHLPPSRFGLLSGPMLAGELEKGSGGAAVLASADTGAMGKLAPLFKKTGLYLEYSTNVEGVALAAVLKNIYAVAIGIADGLGYGNNIKGLLTTRVIKESLIIADLLGIDQEVILGTAGLADLVATGFSPMSHNRAAGKKLVELQAVDGSEGITSLPSLLKLLPNELVFAPILKSLNDIIIDKKNPREVFDLTL